MSIDIFNKVLEEKVQNQNLPDKLNDEISVTKTEEVIENKNPEVVEKKETENEESLEKAIRDTRRNYQNINQKYVLAKKKYNNVINELRETILNENNSVLSEEEFNEHVKKLDSIFEVEKDDELEVENKKEDKVKNLRETLDKEFDTFKKYNLDIISVTSTIVGDEKAKGFTFEFSLNIANIDTVVIKQKDKDLYTAIDIATDRVSKVLRRHNDKITAHKATKFSEAVEVEDGVAKELEKFEDEIIPQRLTSYKPMDIEEALEELKNSTAQFKVFYDKDDNMRVLYKANAAGKFGLY